MLLVVCRNSENSDTVVTLRSLLELPLVALCTGDAGDRPTNEDDRTLRAQPACLQAAEGDILPGYHGGTVHSTVAPSTPSDRLQVPLPVPARSSSTARSSTLRFLVQSVVFYVGGPDDRPTNESTEWCSQLVCRLHMAIQRYKGVGVIPLWFANKMTSILCFDYFAYYRKVRKVGGMRNPHKVELRRITRFTKLWSVSFHS